MKVATGTTGIRLVTAMGCIALLASLTMMSGCRTTPPRRYYTLSYPINRDNATLSRPPLHSIQLRVKPFSVGLPYDRPQIVYRQSPFEFQYYAYQLWAAKPQKMLRELVLSHLEASRLAGDVTQEYGERYPDYELSAEVLAVEEYDSGPVWYGHLEMRFQLVRFRDKIVLWTYHLTASARYTKNSQCMLSGRCPRSWPRKWNTLPQNWIESSVRTVTCL